MSIRIFLPTVLFALLTALTTSTAQADHGRGGYDGVIICESNEGRTRHCPVDTRGGVRLINQRSRSACIEGRSWGWDRRGVWVTRGCRGEFAVGGSRYDRGDRRGRDPGPGYGAVVRCESFNGRFAECRLGRGIREVEIERQLSRNRCEQGYSWGRTRGGIWVDRGCRADFRVY